MRGFNSRPRLHFTFRGANTLGTLKAEKRLSDHPTILRTFLAGSY
jgi:hypothetical protein